VELALHSRFLGTRGVGQQKGKDWVHGSRSRTMSYGIPARKFSNEGPEIRREGGFEDLCPDDFLVSSARLILQEKVVFE
jgi:hypothetical protein